MANKIILKRSSVAAKVPLTTDLDVGELSVNLADAKLYTKNASGTVIQLGGAASTTISDTAPSSPSAGDMWWDSTVGQLRIYYNDGSSSQWVDALNVAGLAGSQGPAGPGVPSGGTVGQFLRKASASDYDTGWADIPAADLYYRKNSTTSLTGSTGGQSWLGLTNGVTVAANTVYEFEGHFDLTTPATSSHTEQISFGLTTATVTNISYFVNRFFNTTTASSSYANNFTSVAAQTITGALTAAQDVSYHLRGTVAFGTGGQFNPLVGFSATIGTPVTVGLGAWFRMTAIGTTGSNSSNGTWS